MFSLWLCKIYGIIWAEVINVIFLRPIIQFFLETQKLVSNGHKYYNAIERTNSEAGQDVPNASE